MAEELTELKRLRDLVSRIDDGLADIISRIEDEEDRAYLGSTNDVETLKELMRETEAEVYRIMAERALPKAYDGCTCLCHRQPGVMHFIACCGTANSAMAFANALNRSETDAG